MDRNLRRVIHKAGVSLHVEFVLIPTTIQLKKPRLRTVPVYWPCFCMKSWILVLLQRFPQFVLGGFKLEEESQWRALFSWFWGIYHQYDPTHPLYEHDFDKSLAIPIATHGDEGRGARNTPFMVQSFQFVISYQGPATTNTSGSLGQNTWFFCICIYLTYVIIWLAVTSWILRDQLYIYIHSTGMRAAPHKALFLHSSPTQLYLQQTFWWWENTPWYQHFLGWTIAIGLFRWHSGGGNPKVWLKHCISTFQLGTPHA